MKKFFSSIIKPPCTVDIELDPSEKFKNAIIEMNNPKDRFGLEGVEQKLMVFDRDDPIQGKVKVTVDKPFDHLGITIELIGEIGKYELVV